MAKTSMIKIVINWTEASEVENWEFKTWGSCNAMLKSWAAKRQNRNGGYYKTAFTVYFENGDTYAGRIDLEYNDIAVLGLLQSHIRDYNCVMGGLQKPYHMSAEDYQNYINAYGGNPAECILWLDTHYLWDTPTIDMLHDYWWEFDTNDYPR